MENHHPIELVINLVDRGFNADDVDDVNISEMVQNLEDKGFLSNFCDPEPFWMLEGLVHEMAHMLVLGLPLSKPLQHGEIGELIREEEDWFKTDVDEVLASAVTLLVMAEQNAPEHILRDSLGTLEANTRTHSTPELLPVFLKDAATKRLAKTLNDFLESV